MRAALEFAIYRNPKSGKRTNSTNVSVRLHSINSESINFLARDANDGYGRDHHERWKAAAARAFCVRSFLPIVSLSPINTLKNRVVFAAAFQRGTSRQASLVVYSTVGNKQETILIAV